MTFFNLAAARLRTGVFEQMRFTRPQRGLMFGVVALLALLPIFYLNANPIPAEQTWTDDTANLHFTASNSRVIFPHQCLEITWQVEGIKTVHINGLGKVGTGTERFCNTLGHPVMEVELQDGTRQELHIGIQKLYQEPVIVLLWVTGTVALALAVYNFAGTWAALAVLTVVLTMPPMLYFIQSEGYRPNANDYVGHIRISQNMMDGTGAIPPHFLYHVASIGWVNVFPGATLKDAAVAILLISNILTCIAVYAIVRLFSGKRPDSNWKWTLIYLGIPLVLFIGPVNFDEPFVIISSYVYPNPPHSPTFILLKPFAVGLFACMVALFSGVPKRWLVVAAMAALTVFASFAKPNYTLPLVPVIGLVVAASFVRPLPVKRWELVAGILIPAVLILGWQYLLTYGPQQNRLYEGEEASILFAPLELFLVHWHVAPLNLLSELVVSLLFPIAVYVLYFREARQDHLLNIAWLIFIAGQALAYLFIESPKVDHGNLVWSGRITALVLFVVTIGFFLRQNSAILDRGKRLAGDRRFYLGALLLALHILPNLRAMFY